MPDPPQANQPGGPDWTKFGLFFSLALAFLIPLLQANGVNVTWLPSLSLYVVLICFSVWTFVTHGIPHKSFIARCIQGGIMGVSIGLIAAYAVVTQYHRDNPPKAVKAETPTKSSEPLSAPQGPLDNDRAKGQRATKSAKPLVEDDIKALRFTAEIYPSTFEVGSLVHGVKWRDDYVYLSLGIQNTARFPIANIDLSIQTEIYIETISAIDKVPGLQIFSHGDFQAVAPEFDDRGKPSGKVKVEGRPMNTNIWQVSCPRLTANDYFTLLVVPIEYNWQWKNKHYPKQLFVKGSYETGPLEGSKRYQVDWEKDLKLPEGVEEPFDTPGPNTPQNVERRLAEWFKLLGVPAMSSTVDGAYFGLRTTSPNGAPWLEASRLKGIYQNTILLRVYFGNDAMTKALASRLSPVQAEELAREMARALEDLGQIYIPDKDNPIAGQLVIHIPFDNLSPLFIAAKLRDFGWQLGLLQQTSRAFMERNGLTPAQGR